MNIKAATSTAGSVADGFFASMPSEKLMTAGLLGFAGSFLLAWNAPENLAGPMAAGGISVVLLLLGYWGTVIRAKANSEIEMAKAAGEKRDTDRGERPTPSGRTRAFCELITVPMTEAEIADIKFEDDDKLKAADARRRVKIARGVDSGVPSGLVVRLPDGRYLARSHYPPNTGDETQMAEIE